MDNFFLQLLRDYDYVVPPELIAQQPAKPRDAARLLVYDRASANVTLDTFLHLDQYLPANAVVVFNDTRVIPARLVLRRATGGSVEILYLARVAAGIRVMANRGLHVGEQLFFNTKISFTVTAIDDRFFILTPSISPYALDVLFDRHGIVPLPPYIKQSPLRGKALRDAYQTIFARHRGSVAAPTASLHFTDRLFKKIQARGIAIKFVTLHVNLGTFAPLTEDAVHAKRLHVEEYSIDSEVAEFLTAAKREGRPIIAVGTTVARTLESASDSRGVLGRLRGETDLFIRDGDRFKFVDGLVTNFHVPKSSLLMLVAALVGREKLFALYERAIAERFRFFSFGDGMLVI